MLALAMHTNLHSVCSLYLSCSVCGLQPRSSTFVPTINFQSAHRFLRYDRIMWPARDAPMFRGILCGHTTDFFPLGRYVAVVSWLTELSCANCTIPIAHHHVIPCTRFLRLRCRFSRRLDWNMGQDQIRPSPCCVPSEILAQEHEG